MEVETVPQIDNSSVVATFSLISLFEQRQNNSLLPVVRDNTVEPDGLEEPKQPWYNNANIYL